MVGPPARPTSSPLPSRRSFLRGALVGVPAAAVAASGAAALAGCGGDPIDDDAERLSSAPPGRIPVGVSGDADLLNGALAAEHLQVAAYTSGLPLLDPPALLDAERFLQQERRHVERLQQLIAGVGATPVGARPSYDFGLPGTAADVLRILHDVEQETIAVYVQIVPRLADPVLRATAASIAAVEAEHDAVLLQRLGRWPVPTAFVTGGR
ncbi:ferritin-like domain-containing protein [Conexibacter sp. CPCC 206217]|nr:ferritin-like domain-containing protein [Conexibacter sp. CPCC 206217]